MEIQFFFRQYTEPNNIDISDDGRYIFYTTFSDSLVENDPHIGETIGNDGFIYDRITKHTKVIPLSEFDNDIRIHGAEVGSISSNGRYVVFATDFAILPSVHTHGYQQLFVYDSLLESVKLVFSPESMHPLITVPLIFGIPQISNDGNHCLFATAGTKAGSGVSFDSQGGLYLLSRNTTSHIGDWQILK